MRAHDLEVLLLANEPNIRYATGATAMPPYAMSTFVRCAVVPAKGVPILFEHGNSMHRSRGIALDVRPMHAWEFFDDPMAEAEVWAREVVAAMDELGVDRRAIGLDRLGTPGFLALPEAGSRVRRFGSGDAGSARGEDARGDPAVPGQRADRDRAAPHVRGGDRPRGAEREVFAAMAADRAAPGASSTTPRTPSARAPTRTRGEPKPRTARSSPATSSTSTPTRSAWAGRSSASLARSPVGDADAARSETPIVPRTTGSRQMKALVRPGHHLRRARRRAPRCRPSGTCRSATNAWSTGSGWRRRTPASASRPTASPTATACWSRACCSWSSSIAGEVGAGHGVKLGDEVLVTHDGIEVLAPYPFDDALWPESRPFRGVRARD